MISFNRLGRLGRLGNQMFQYAALLGIARRMGYELCIPLPAGGDAWGSHLLFEAFDLTGVTRTGESQGAPELKERHFHFDPEIAYACPDGVDLAGFFQTWRYFEDVDELVRREFTFKDDVSAACRQAIGALGPSVIGLHVRRTDYLEKTDNHPVLEIDYYDRALRRLPGALPVLVFSDDIDWCKAQPLFGAPRFVFSEGRSNIADLCLMSMCRHHIIANSSFSWWGAWLDPAPDKTVIAPRQWFGLTGYARLHDTSDLTPAEWARI